MTINKPTLERVSPTFGSSFLVKHFPEARPNKPPKWHYHPEVELVYIRGGSGRRRIGTHVSYFTDGDLVLIGANLPHWGFTEAKTNHEAETVIQFLPEHLGDSFIQLPELQNLRKLLKLAQSGLSFHGQTRDVQGKRLEELIKLDPLPRLLQLIDILHELSVSSEIESLNVAGFLQRIDSHEIERWETVQQFVNDNFDREVALQEIADLAAMTVPAFCRYFKRISGKTFVRYLNEYRITHACKLLAESHSTISEIAFNCGYNTLSQFNRCFKQITGTTPSFYRSGFGSVV